MRHRQRRVRLFDLDQRPHLEALEVRRLLSASAAAAPEVQAALELFHTSPALFVENQGQWADESVRYVHSGSGANIAMTDAGPVFQLFRDTPADPIAADRPRVPGDLPSPRKLSPQPGAAETRRFSASFVGANAVTLTGRDRSDSTFNYFRGDEPAWRSDVPAYTTVVYENLYDGIDLHNLGQRTNLKYEFHVAPGGDPSQIAIRYDGIERLSIDSDGSLVVKLGEDWAPLIDATPYVYQEIDGQRVEIDSRYVLMDDSTYAFFLADYDRSLELVIDPELTWGSYLGGTGNDKGLGVAVDSLDSVLVTGLTQSSGWTSGGYDTSFNGGWDAFVAKFSPTGGHLWTTYLGGLNSDYGYGITVDVSDNVIVAGLTDSSGWTSGGFDSSHNGDWDGFVAKLLPTGGHLWSTYLGGGEIDYCNGIATDSFGNVLLTGYTLSSAWTSGGFDTSLGGGADGFVAKLSPTGSHLWSTYLGGSEPNETGVSIAADPSDNILVTGTIYSSGWASGGMDTSYNGGEDAFVAKLSPSGGHLWSTYLGGAGGDAGTGIAVNGAGNIVVTGTTTSAGWPSGGFDISHNGSNDAFIARLSSTGGHLWSTYLGGSEDDYANGIALDVFDNVVVTGYTFSPSWTSVGFDTHFDGGPDGDLSDGFVAKLSSAGSHLWSTYLGGTSGDSGTGITFDTSGNVFVTGSTGSSGWVGGGFDTTFNGFQDTFVAKISDGTIAGLVIDSINPNPVPGLNGDQTITLIGSGFMVGAVVWLRDLTHGGFYQTTPITITNSRITISANVTTATATWSVEVINPGNASSGQKQFSVMAPTAVDSDDRIATATALGALFKPREPTDAISSATDVDIYSFDVQRGQRVSFDVDIVSGDLDPYIRLFSSTGAPATPFAGSKTFNDNQGAPGEPSTTSEAYLEYTFNTAGTYYIGISSASNIAYNPITGDNDKGGGATGAYRLALKAWMTNGELIGTQKRFDIRRYAPDDTGGLYSAAIDPDVETWIVIHGRNSSRSKPNIDSLARAIFKDRTANANHDFQVLTLDWEKAAVGLDLLGVPIGFSGEGWIEDVATWASNALTTYGFATANLNIVGHSWGANVAGEIARRFDGGVNTILAIDPADNGPDSSYNPNTSIQFGQNSRFSWAFYASSIVGVAIPGSETTPGTAHEAFVVQNAGHSDIVYVLANLLGHPGVVSDQFALNRLLAYTRGPWITNQYRFTGDRITPFAKVFEGVIASTGNDGASFATKIEYVSRFETASSGLADWVKTGNAQSTSPLPQTFVMQLTEGSDAAITRSITLPPVASALTFDYHFTLHGIGDRLVVRINGTEVWSKVGTDDVSSELVSSGAIDISQFAGEDVELEIRLSTVEPSTGDGSSQVWVDNVSILETTAESIDLPVGGSQAQVVVYTDADGTTATIQLTGGEGTLHFTGDDLVIVQNKKVVTVSGSNLAMSHLQVDNAVKANLQVRLKGGDGRVVWGGLTVDGSASAINLAGVNFVGDVTVTGLAQSLTLGNVTGNRVISLGGIPTDKAARVTSGHLSDVAVTSSAPLQLTVLSWIDTDPDTNPDLLTAPYATTIVAKGDKANNISGRWEADVTFSGQGATKETMRSFKADSLSNATFAITGGIGTIDVAKGIVSGFALAANADVRTVKLGDVADTSLTAGDFGAVQAARWLGGQIIADTVQSIRAIGDGTKTITGHWDADVTLSGLGATRETLKSFTAQSLSDSTFAITGSVGSFNVSNGVTAGLTFANTASVGSVSLGDAADVSLTAGALGAVQAIRWLGGQITAETVKSIRTLGSTKANIPGDMTAALTIQGNPAATTALGSATIAGRLSGTWNITGPTGAIQAGDVDLFTGNVVGAVKSFGSKASFSGMLAAFSFSTVDIKANLVNARLIAGGSALPAFINSLKIGGGITGSSLFVGLDPVNGVFGDGDDVMLTGQTNLIKSISIGGATDGIAPMFFAGLFPKSVSINKVTVDPLADSRFVVSS